MMYQIQVNKNPNDIRLVTVEEYEEIGQDFPVKILWKITDKVMEELSAFFAAKNIDAQFAQEEE